MTEQPSSNLLNDLVDKAFLKKHVGDFEQQFYVCGPPKMIEDVTAALKELGADVDSITFEE